MKYLLLSLALNMTADYNLPKMETVHPSMPMLSCQPCIDNGLEHFVVQFPYTEHQGNFHAFNDFCHLYHSKVVPELDHQSNIKDTAFDDISADDGSKGQIHFRIHKRQYANDLEMIWKRVITNYYSVDDITDAIDTNNYISMTISPDGSIVSDKPF